MAVALLLVNGLAVYYTASLPEVELHRFFYPRRYAKAQSLRWSGVRPSVCLFVTFVYCIQTVEDIVEFLYRPGSPIISVCSTLCADTQFQGNPVGDGAKYTRRWENFAIFD